MAEVPTPPGVDRHARLSGLRIHYREAGPPDAPAVVVLHGIMGHLREWDTLTAALAATHRVIGVDQRGHGESDWAEEYTAAAMAGDVAGLIELLHLRRVRLVGHSMGAMVAMLYAAQRPDIVDRLVVIDVGPDSLATAWGAHELPAMLLALAAASYAHPRQAVEEWLAGNPLAQEPLLRHYVEHCLRPRPDGRLVWRFDALGLRAFATDGVSAAQLWRALDRITAPTLVIRGEQSPLLSREQADRMLRRLAVSTCVEIPGGGHDLGVEQPRAVAAAVLDFLLAAPAQPAARRLSGRRP